jgi:hypothetical protein
MNNSIEMLGRDESLPNTINPLHKRSRGDEYS